MKTTTYAKDKGQMPLRNKKKTTSLKPLLSSQKVVNVQSV